MRLLLTLLLAAGLAAGLAACGGDDAPDSGVSTAGTATPDASAAGSAAGGLDPSLPYHDDYGDAPVDAALASAGETLFNTRCQVCHKLDERYVGPPLRDVATRREPEWIMNMILAPDKMLMVDEAAKELFGEYNVPMTNQNLTPDEARQIVEYLRRVSTEPAAAPAGAAS